MYVYIYLHLYKYLYNKLSLYNKLYSVRALVKKKDPQNTIICRTSDIIQFETLNISFCLEDALTPIIDSSICLAALKDIDRKQTVI